MKLCKIKEKKKVSSFLLLPRQKIIKLVKKFAVIMK